MPSSLQSILGFLIILCPLVVFHEFGHYIFARIFGVKAEIFSVGFGPTLWKKQMGETEVRVSAIPLGGYVKLLGEDRDTESDPELLKRSLHRQAPWKRFFIFFGGPLFNFIFAIFIFSVILVIGEPQIASVASRVVHQSAAEKAGFRSGDRILKIDGKPVRKYEEVISAINDSPNKEMSFEVLHMGSATSPVTVKVTPTTQDGFSVYGESTRVGEIDGLQPTARATEVGVSNPASAVYKVGVRTGQKLVSINGQKVSDFEDAETKFAEAASGAVQPATFSFVFSDKTGEHSHIFSGDFRNKSLEQAIGLHSSELFVQNAVPDSPALKAGVREGDRLIGVGGVPVHSFFELKDAVQRAGEKTGRVDLSWERDGKVITAQISPSAKDGRDALMKKTTTFTVGVVPMLTLAEPPTVIERVLNPFTLVYKATERMFVLSWRNLMSIRKMFTGDVSVATLGGPIMIGKIAGESLAHGLIAFLTTMGILSIGLGVLNILPVPVLDGGHLLLLGVEMIRRRPLTMRQMEIVQGVGLFLILGLMGIVIKNDIARLF